MKTILLLSLPVLLLIATSFRLKANTDITGDVRNEKGLPVQNVNVLVAGTALHAITDEDGEYDIDSVPDGATLNFSAAGFVAKAEKINGRETVNVILLQAGATTATGGANTVSNTGTVELPVTVVGAKSSKLVYTINKILAWGPQLVQAATIVQNVQQKFREGKTKKAAEKKALVTATPAAPFKQNLKQEPAAEEMAMEKPY